MPNSRRRKFSVRNGIAGREPSKIQNGLQTSAPSPNLEIKTVVDNVAAMRSKLKNKMNTNSSSSSSKSSNIDIISECESSASMVTVKKLSNTTVDKNVTASSSNNQLFNSTYPTEELTEPLKDDVAIVNTIERTEMLPKRDTREATRAPLKREKHPRQHRVKVRSPKRRMGIGILDTHNKNNIVTKPTISIGTEAIDWECEVEICNNVTNVVDTTEDDERQSDHSSDDMCRICHGGDSLSQELGQLISACSCRGTVGRVHVKCLERWLTESGKTRCELCGTRYATRRVHRYGVPRALVMWILSQNAKQLVVDSLGIMLMSPLAVLAAWLSGRTLAGLMMQDARATPWPLASTFVLACMTLVCYYCWIVSAATRHALGWWIWYRAQYEVRLELFDVED